MDQISLFGAMPSDKDLPARSARIAALTSVLEGRQYDHLKHAFSDETTSGGEYIRLQHRRPSFRSNLCRTVVDDSVSLLFGEGHFPQIVATEKRTVLALNGLAKSAKIALTFTEAATKGSVGSVAIQVRILAGCVYVDALNTANLTPVWNPRAPNKLLRVVERYKVSGRDLIAQGYSDIDSVRDYWFQRVWDDESEIWYLPFPVISLASDTQKTPVIDPDRTIAHGQKAVPIVWITNLPGGDATDGACTFESAISTVIEIDYLMSQAGRALRLAGDVTLVLKVPPRISEDGKSVPMTLGGASDVLEIPPEGDAHILEITGEAARAAKEHVEKLRQYALESIHGNRSDSEKISAATSGRALELMNQGLVWLADKLRVSYVEYGLREVLKLVIAASNLLREGVIIDGVAYKGLSAEGLGFRWPDFYPPTSEERQTDIQALAAAKTAGLMSRKTAVSILAATYDIEDVDAELALIDADKAADLASIAMQPGAIVKVADIAEE
jgi:hypothetical protein